MLNFNTAQEASFGRVTVESVSLEDRLVFIKKVYTLLAASMATAAIGAYIGTGPTFTDCCLQQNDIVYSDDWPDLLCPVCSS